MQYKEINILVQGMHCKSCEMLIEAELSEISGVKSVKANFNKGVVAVYGDEQVDSKNIEKQIEKLGYRIGSKVDSNVFISRDKKSFQDLGIAALILAVIFVILKSLGVTNLNFGSGSDGITIPIVLIVGLTAGVSTCMALVGGLVLGTAAKYNEKHPEASSRSKFVPHLFFNLGRILGFAILGGILGLLGSVFQLSGTVLGVLTIFIGLIMLIMGLQIIGIFPWAEKLKLTLPKFIGQKIGLNQKKSGYSHWTTMILGAVTFFLPCGFTQAMQVYAVSSGSFLGGAIIMSLFALGTAPGLLGIGGLSAIVKGRIARRFFKLAGLAVLIFAVINISNGLGLTGWSLASTNSNIVSNDPNVTIENGVQVVRMTETSNGYSPNTFTIQKNVPVKWIIDAQAPYSCASTILLNKFNIRQMLVAGENVINFTPTEIGRLSFSCSMGMYTGYFNVVDQTTKDKEESAEVTSGAIISDQVDPSVVQAKQAKVLRATYTNKSDLQPSEFVVKVNQSVRFEIDVKDDGSGCMSTIKIQGLFDTPQTLEKNKKIIMEFTPTQTGDYLITCAMNIPRGTIKVE